MRMPSWQPSSLLRCIWVYKMDKFKLGIIGLGCRGTSMTELLAEREDVDIVAVCDEYEDRCESMRSKLEEKGYSPKIFQNFEELIAATEVEVVFVFSAWENHVPAVVASMKAHKPVAFEVGGAYSIEDCFLLCETHRATGTPAMMLENCCYGRKESTLYSMARADVFGELIHLCGGYNHDLRDEVSGGIVNRHYRLRNYRARNCENYPTHELGPINVLLGIGHGNRFVSLSSFSSKSAGLDEYIRRHPECDASLADGKWAQGDVVTTVLTTSQGQTVRLTLDTTLPRPYSRGLELHGTKGWFMEDNMSVYTDADNTHADHFRWRNFWGNFTQYEEKYMPRLWRDYLDNGVKKGHGGMDFLVLDAFLTAVREGDAMPLDIYDSAIMMAVTPLSEQSIKQGGAPVAFPDITKGLESRTAAKGKYNLF